MDRAPPGAGAGRHTGPGLDRRAARRLRPTPGQTEGPFCPVEVPADSDADLLRNGALAYHRGVETWIDGRVSDVDGALHGAHPAHPCEGAAG